MLLNLAYNFFFETYIQVVPDYFHIINARLSKLSDLLIIGELCNGYPKCCQAQNVQTALKDD